MVCLKVLPDIPSAPVLNALSDPTHVFLIIQGMKGIWRNEASLMAFGRAGLKCHEFLFGHPSVCRDCPIEYVFETGETQTKRIRRGQKIFDVTYRLFLGKTLGVLAKFEDATDKVRLSAKCRTDLSTGLLNKVGFLETVAQEACNVERYGYPSSIIMADFDNFKIINDDHGHDVGDQVLLKFAEILKGVLRRGDVASRFGGDEFNVLLKNTDIHKAHETAERIRRDTQEVILREMGIETSISVGVHEIDGLARDPHYYIKKLSQQVKLSKEGGKNRVSVAPGQLAFSFGMAAV